MMKNIFTLILLFVSIASHAQDFWSKVEDDLFKKMQTPEFVNYALGSYSLTGMPKEVIREHMVELYKSREVSKFLVKEMRQAGLEKLEQQDMEAYGRKFGAELFLSLAMKGMARLDSADQRNFISFMNTWLNHASVQDCKWMMTDGATSSASESGKIELKYYGKFKQEELRSYFRFLRKSMLAEINDFPYPRTINADQIKIADDALQVVFERKFKQQSVRIETLKAMTDMNNASAKDVCDAGKLIFSSILDMKGFTGDLMITKFILSIR
jgi:hypothetical protein